MVNNQCQPDLSCNSTAACLDCPATYLLSSGQCQDCQSAGQHCAECSAADRSRCVDCLEGYALESGGCSPCATGCKKCLSPAYCVECEAGYFDVMHENGTGTGVCKMCEQVCSECWKTSKQCTSCASGYYFNGWKCSMKDEVAFELELSA